jgi:hypothetical protein
LAVQNIGEEVRLAKVHPACSLLIIAALSTLSWAVVVAIAMSVLSGM